MKKNKRQKAKKLSRDDVELSLLALPTFIWFILFCYLPMFGIIIAFKNFKISGGGFIDSLIKSKWVGLDNFKFLFATDDAWIITRNTIFYNIAFIIIGLFLSVFLALCLNELINRSLSKAYQTALFLPHFLSWVVISYFVFTFLSHDKGILNNILASFGIDNIWWYSNKQYWPFIIIFVNAWKGMGYGTVVYLAAIAGIDRSLYEAALIDGAGKYQQIKHITLPLLKPIITILLILNIGKIFNSDFGLFYQLPRQSGALLSVTNTIDTYVYRTMMNVGNIGQSSAAALFQSVIGLILISLSNSIVNRFDKENALF